ncbi:hypothetical protein [Undibacterium sp. Ji49W]
MIQSAPAAYPQTILAIVNDACNCRVIGSSPANRDANKAVKRSIVTG